MFDISALQVYQTWMDVCVTAALAAFRKKLEHAVCWSEH